MLRRVKQAGNKSPGLVKCLERKRRREVRLQFNRLVVNIFYSCSVLVQILHTHFRSRRDFLVTLQLCSVFSPPPSKVVKPSACLQAVWLCLGLHQHFFFSVSIIFSIALRSITRQKISRLFSCPQRSAVAWGKVVSSEVSLKYDDYLGWFGAHMVFNHLWSC